MTTAEIKALVAKPLLKPVNCREKAMFTAIEILLTRQAEVLARLKRMHTLSRDDNVNVALWDALDAARAILNPENDVAWTESEKRHYQNHLRDRAEIEGRD